MPLLMLKEIPRYECLQEAAAQVKDMKASACDAFLHILSTGDAASKAEGVFLSSHGLSQGRLIVLMLLEECGEPKMRSSDLANHASVSRATMTGLLDSLERDGLVARTLDPNDRRATQVTITEQGREMLEKTIPHYFRWISQALAALTDRERTQLARLLRKAHRAFIPPATDKSA